MNKIFWVKEPNQDNENRGYIERIEYGKDGVVLFDEKEGKIDVNVLKPHIDEEVEYYRNGELDSKRVISGVEANEDGVMTIYIDTIEETVAKGENEI